MKSTVSKSIVKGIQVVFILFAQLIWAQNTQESQEPRASKTDKIGIPNILFSGILLKNTEKNRTWYIPNAFELFPANTVEGFVVNPQVRFTQNYESGRFFSLNPNLRYGFGNERFQAQLKSRYYYSPKNFGLLELSGGRTVEQLYDESTLSAFNNTLSTFALNENLLKIYERTYVELGHTFSPVKDFLLTTNVSWNERNPLENLTKYEENEDFTSNNPENFELDDTAFTRNNAVLVEGKLRWQLGHQMVRQRGELVSKGKYPALTLSYINATDAILGGDVSFQKLAFSVQDDFEIGDYSFGKAFVEVGDFLSQDNLTFVDFNHFKGKETVYGTYDIDQFQLLEYYQNSTADFYVQAHYEHYFRPFYFIYDELNYRPVAGIRYLYTEAGGHYAELGIGMDKMFSGNWRVDLYNSFRDGEHESFGVRVGLNFD